MVHSSGHKYSVIRFLFIRSSGFGLIDSTLQMFTIQIPSVLKSLVLIENLSNLKNWAPECVWIVDGLGILLSVVDHGGAVSRILQILGRLENVRHLEADLKKRCYSVNGSVGHCWNDKTTFNIKYNYGKWQSLNLLKYLCHRNIAW